MDTQRRAEAGRQRVNFRLADVLELKPYYILDGVPLETLAALLASRYPGRTVEQALFYLSEIRARENWVREREDYVRTLGALASARALEHRADAIAMGQASIAEQLVNQGLEEVARTTVHSRTEALKTLEMGYRFAYRAQGLPDRISDPAVLPKGAGFDSSQDQGARAARVASLSDQEVIGLVRRLLKNTPLPTEAERGIDDENLNQQKELQ